MRLHAGGVVSTPFVSSVDNELAMWVAFFQKNRVFSRCKSYIHCKACEKHSRKVLVILVFLPIGSCRLTDFDTMLKLIATLCEKFSSVLCSLFFCLTNSFFMLCLVLSFALILMKWLILMSYFPSIIEQYNKRLWSSA